jgi:hypothetical protein
MRLRLVSGLMLMLMVSACGGSGSADSEPELDELRANEPAAVRAEAGGPGVPDWCLTALIAPLPNDGICGEPHVCGLPDPDCTPPSSGNGGAGAAGSAGVPDWCLTALIAPLPNDGICGEPHVCGLPDPDCTPSEPVGYDCDTSKITCQTFAPVVCPDGQVPTVVDECYGECVPKDKCAAVDDGGENDGVVCAAFIEQPDGKCSRPDDDPCRSQDPDCTLP